MKCGKSTADCKLELKFHDNGDVLEFCSVCNFSHLHEVKNIKNNELNPNNKKD